MTVIVGIFDIKCACISLLIRNYIDYKHISDIAQTVL